MQDQQLRTIKAHGRSNGPRALGRLEEVLEQLREIHNACIGTTSRVMLKVAGKAMVQTGNQDPGPKRPAKDGLHRVRKARGLGLPPCEVRINYEHGLLCEECARQHRCQGYLMPVVNSPRMGACGYIGQTMRDADPWPGETGTPSRKQPPRLRGADARNAAAKQNPLYQHPLYQLVHDHQRNQPET